MTGRPDLPKRPRPDFRKADLITFVDVDGSESRYLVADVLPRLDGSVSLVVIGDPDDTPET